MRYLILCLLPLTALAKDTGITPLSAARADLGVAEGSDPEQLSNMVDDAIHNLARSRNEEALAAFERKDFPAALTAFRQAHELNPRDAEITNNMAYLYQLLGSRAASEKMYRLTLKLDRRRGMAYQNLAELLAGEGATTKQLTEASELLVRARELRGNKPAVIVLQAQVAVRRGRFDTAERFYVERAKLSRADVLCVEQGPYCLEVGDFYRDLGKPTQALAWYRRVNNPSDGSLETAVRRIRELEVQDVARRYGWRRPLDEVPDQARTLADRGRAQFRQGRQIEAARLLQEAIALAPRFARAHADLGDVQQAIKDVIAAELSYLRALAMAQGDADILRRLGAFYLKSKRPAEGAFFLTQAVEQRPDWSDLQRTVAQAWQAAGDPARALDHINLYLDAQPEDAPNEDAQAFKKSLEAALPERLVTTKSDDTNRTLIAALQQARAFLERGEPDAALAELKPLKREPDVLNLKGLILRRTRKLDQAAKAFEASLALNPSQTNVRMQLAEVHQRRGESEAARQELLRAEKSGSPKASLTLAELDARASPNDWPRWVLDVDQWADLRAAQARLHALVIADADTSVVAQAQTLLDSVNARLRNVLIAAGAGILLILLPLIIAARRFWGGVDLGKLVAIHPETGPEIQRILAAIRHEVLKHNTMVLTGLAEAVESGADVSEDAAWCRRSLLGGPDGSDWADSAYQKLKGYADRLAQIGRAHGIRLNLRRKDPALSALLGGFEVLKRNAGLFDRADRLRLGARGRLSKALRQAAQLLNVEGYEAVRALLNSLRVLPVDGDVLRTVFERTCHEPAFADADIAPLAFEGDKSLPVWIPIPRHAFEDVITNLIRNAIQSTLRHGSEPVRIGLSVATEEDMITGIERAVFLIRDASPQQLTPEMLRGRYIEAGLGLTADIVSQYEGTLDVTTQADPWIKAVVLKLPCVDEDEDQI